MNARQKKKAAAAQAQRILRIKQDRKRILSDKSGFYIQEAYKTLRTNVNFALTDHEQCKVVMVTSSLQSEGKSLNALNLAISLGQTDQKVLLIDADMRRPRLARLLNLSAPAGLSNLLMDFGVMDVAIFKHEEYGIDVILSGDIPPNPAELLASGRIAKLLTLLREQYDYIIIDTPPVDLVIDSTVLAPLCDGVLFVVRIGQSERGAVIHAMEQLAYVKASVIGFVFNGVTAETGTGYGKYRYRHYGRYGYRYGRYGYWSGYRYGYRYGYGYSHYGYSSHSDAHLNMEEGAPQETKAAETNERV